MGPPIPFFPAEALIAISESSSQAGSHNMAYRTPSTAPLQPSIRRAWLMRGSPMNPLDKRPRAARRIHSSTRDAFLFRVDLIITAPGSTTVKPADSSAKTRSDLLGDQMLL